MLVKKGARPRTIPKNKKEWLERLHKMEEVMDKPKSKKDEDIRIDWKGTAEYYMDEDHKNKKNNFNKLMVLLIILIWMLFSIDYTMYMMFFR